VFQPYWNRFHLDLSGPHHCDQAAGCPLARRISASTLRAWPWRLTYLRAHESRGQAARPRSLLPSPLRTFVALNFEGSPASKSQLAGPAGHPDQRAPADSCSSRGLSGPAAGLGTLQLAPAQGPLLIWIERQWGMRERCSREATGKIQQLVRGLAPMGPARWGPVMSGSRLRRWTLSVAHESTQTYS